MPGSAHLLYIPAILIVGIILGFIIGGRAARDAYAMEAIRDEERREARARRQRRKKEGTPSNEDEEAH